MHFASRCFRLPLLLLAYQRRSPRTGTLTRSFVSSTGVDTNACTIAAPCATFAHAYTAVGANGIVAALDPGKYGPITIIGPVTIKGYGWAAITAPANDFGIEVRAGPSDNVTLTGLQVDGAGAGSAGINLDSAGTLTVIDCMLQNFAGTAIFRRSLGTGIDTDQRYYPHGLDERHPAYCRL